MEKFSQKIINFRWAITIVVFAITIFLGFQIKNIRFNSDVISSLPDDDSIAALYKQIGTEFSGNEMGMIVIESDNVFKTEVLAQIRQITDSIKSMPEISTVTSMTSVIDIRSNAEGIEIGKLVDEYNIPQTREQLDSLKNYVFSKEMYKGALVSEDTTATVILFTLLPESEPQQCVSKIKKMMAGLNLPVKVHYGGMPIIIDDFNNLMIADITKLLPIVFVIIALVLLIGFRSIRGVVLPLLTAGIAVVWTIGLMALTGYEITIISNVIPVVLLAVGSAYTIHVINSLNHEDQTDNKKTLIKALAYVFIPVFLSAVTTAIGFVSFVFGSYLIMIKDFGIFTAIGTLIALILSLIFVPALISIVSVNGKKGKQVAENHKKTLLTRFVASAVLTHPKYLFSSWILVIAISIFGVLQIKTSASIVDYFKKDSPTKIAEKVMQQKFGGSMPVFVVFEGDVQSPELLQLMDKTADFMKKNPNISKTQSVADLIEEMNDAMGEGKSIPNDKAKIEQLWFLLEGQDIMPQLVSGDLQKGIIQSKFANVETSELEVFIDEMNEYIQNNSTSEVKIKLSGIPSVYNKINKTLIESQLSSLFIAIILVLVIVGLILKSFSKGVYATIPIIATIMLLFGFMGITGIPLDIATVLVASIALGIGVDYSIHVISGFNEHLKACGDVDLAIEQTINTSGKAIIINVLSVAAGFLVLLFSQIVPLQSFGLLVAISMAGSGFGALTLLPVILILANRKRKISAK